MKTIEIILADLKYASDTTKNVCLFDRINNNKFFLLNNSEIVSYLALGLGQPSIEVRLINGGSTKENSLYQ